MLMTIRKFSESLRYLTSALEIDSTLCNSTNMASDYHNMGNTYMFMAEYDRAEYYIAKSKKLNEKTGIKDGLAANLSSPGIIYVKRGEASKGIGLLWRSYEMSTKMNNDYFKALILSSLGESYYLLGEYEKSKEHYVSAQLLFKKLGNENAYAICVAGLGNVLRDKGLYDAALIQYDESLGIFRKNDYYIGQVNVLQNMANLYTMMNRDLDAFGCLFKASGILLERDEEYRAFLDSLRSLTSQ
jgi:tetratricopeptide (TPR) repeat protein